MSNDAKNKKGINSNSKEVDEKSEAVLRKMENENRKLKEQISKMDVDTWKYLGEGIEKQLVDYPKELKELIKIKSVKKCEKYINKILGKITRNIDISENKHYLDSLVKSIDGDKNKSADFGPEGEEILNRMLTAEQKERLEKLKEKKKNLLDKIEEQLRTQAKDVFPLLYLSQEKRDLLMSLALWKANILLAKQMNKYSLIVLILTIIIVISTIISLLNLN